MFYPSTISMSGTLAEPRSSFVSPLVSYLFFGRGPAYVARFIVSVVVDAVDAVLRGRFRTNVGYKRLKTITPFFAHGDAPTAVTRPRFSARVMTTLLRMFPATVFRSSVGRCSPTVFGKGFSSGFQSVTPTTFGVTTSKVPSTHLPDFSTRACNGPFNLSVVRPLWQHSCYSQSAKYSTRQIDEFAHAI